MKVSEQWMSFMQDIEVKIAAQHKRIDTVVDHNQWKVLRAFQKHKVSDFHFAGSTGYGYNDRGREILDLVYAEVFGAEAGLVRPHFASGTHTISAALFGVLRPGDELLYITGKPYDTLHKVIGKPNDGTGSLQDFGIGYDHVDLLADGAVNWDAVQAKLNKRTKVAAIQRSRGYDWRSSFSIEQIKRMVMRLRELAPNIIIFVDNCYGEFTEKLEPTDVGVDLMAGSLIKNPGGGLASSGGYIVGNQTWVELASYRQTAPGIGSEVGAMLGETRAIYQGFFLAPHLVGQAVKGSVFAAACFEQLGFKTSPHWSSERTDLIQAIQFTKKEHLIAFVQSVQRSAPVDSHVVPEPWDMPGYDHPVIMAAGTFIQGGSLELSADAPIRVPYIAYMQGGLTYSHVKFAVLQALEQFQSEGLL
jgi:cystathionine beta-lyase family protein involved in aluminum resistance